MLYTSNDPNRRSMFGRRRRAPWMARHTTAGAAQRAGTSGMTSRRSAASRYVRDDEPAQRSEPVRHGSHGRFQRPRQSFPLATRICEACPGAQGCAPTIRPAQRSEQVRQGCRRCARDRSGNPGAMTKGAARRLLSSRGVVAESPTRRSRGAPFPLFISLRNSLSCRGCRRTARPCARAPAPWCRGRGR